MANEMDSAHAGQSVKEEPSAELGSSQPRKVAANASAVTTSTSAASQAHQNGEPAAEPTPQVLVEDKIFIAEKQFSVDNTKELRETAQRLGATISPHGECTILLVNPHSAAYKDEIAKMAAIKTKYPKVVQPTVLPYHWLLTCFARSARVDPTEPLVVPSPIIVSPNGSLDHGPLKVWVSVNINRTETEADAFMAQSTVKRQLQERGALVVAKRAVADILVVDRNSQFFSKTIMKEREKYSRKSQRIVERDWVDDCVKNGRMVWPPMEQDAEGEAEADSMAEDELPRVGRGPGRPTGKPRIEYTPADGDFLCRYLAAYHSGGSWMSRKTYRTMCSMADQFPIITRHPEQSWHEHFKKNSGTYEGRIRRYIQEGMDQTLRTDKERQADRAKKRERRGREAARQEEESGAELEHGVEIPAEGPPLPPPAAGIQDVDTESTGQAGSSGRHRTVAAREGARLTQIAAEAIEGSAADVELVLVTLADSGAPHSEPQAGPSTKRKRPDEEVPTGLGPPRVPPAARVASPPANPPAKSTAPRAGVPTGASVPPKLGRGPKSIPTEPTRSEPPSSSQQNRVPNPPPREQVGEENLAGSTALNPQRALKPGSSGPAPVQSSTGTVIPAEPKRGPQPPPAQPIPAESSATRPRAPEPEPSTTELQVPQPAANETPSQNSQHRSRATSSNSRRFSTPAQTPGGRRSLLQEGIRSSESKRRRMLERAADRGRKQGESAEPDMVYRPSYIMPAPQFIASRSATPTAHPPAPARSPSPPLSRGQREARVAQGHQLVLAMQLEYGERIKGFARKYNTLPSRVVQMMDELKSVNGGRGGGAQVYWEHVEEALREKYGY